MLRLLRINALLKVHPLLRTKPYRSAVGAPLEPGSSGRGHKFMQGNHR